MKVENIVAPASSDGPGLLKYYHICYTNHLLNIIKSEEITLRDCKSICKVQNV